MNRAGDKDDEGSGTALACSVESWAKGVGDAEFNCRAAWNGRTEKAFFALDNVQGGHTPRSREELECVRSCRCSALCTQACDAPRPSSQQTAIQRQNSGIQKLPKSVFTPQTCFPRTREGSFVAEVLGRKNKINAQGERGKNKRASVAGLSAVKTHCCSMTWVACSLVPL